MKLYHLILLSLLFSCGKGTSELEDRITELEFQLERKNDTIEFYRKLNIQQTEIAEKRALEALRKSENLIFEIAEKTGKPTILIRYDFRIADLSSHPVLSGMESFIDQNGIDFTSIPDGNKGYTLIHGKVRKDLSFDLSQEELRKELESFFRLNAK